MADKYENQVSEKLQGRTQAIVVSCILGLGSLVSWNILLTVGDYYHLIFPDYHPSRVLPFVYQLFAVGTIITFSFHESKISTRKRILIGYVTFAVSSFLLIILDLITKGHGGIGQYIGLCAIVASFGFADAAVRGGMIGDLSLMCPGLIQSFAAGMAVAGALTSVFRLISKATFQKSHDGLRKGAMLFLAMSTCIEFLCVLLYTYVFPKIPIVKFYRQKAALEGLKTVSADLAAASIQNQSYLPNGGTDNQRLGNNSTDNQRLGNKELLLQNKDHAVNLFLIFALTLSILPGFLYENTGQHGLGTWYVLVLITMYNWWDMIGRYAILVKWLKIESRKGLLFAVLLRFILIPAFYFTAKYGDQGWMIMLVSVLGLTTGHLTVCILTIAPNGYKAPEQNAIGNLMAIFMLGGALAGVSSGFLWLIGKQGAV